MRRLIAMLATTGVALIALPAVAHADVSITDFDVTPACTTPGGAVTSRLGVKQNHWYHVHPVWARVLISQAQSGVVVSQSDEGPRWVPFGAYQETRTDVVPANAATGDYTISVVLGSSLGASDWASASRPLKVRQDQLLCAL
jgi:hypothetical protein